MMSLVLLMFWRHSCFFYSWSAQMKAPWKAHLLIFWFYCPAPALWPLKSKKTLTWELVRHLTGVDDGERRERTGETDNNEAAEYQLTHRCSVEYIWSTPVTRNSNLTVASAPSFISYIATHDLINIIMFSPPFRKKNPMNLLPIDSKWKPLCIDVIFQGNSS